MMDTKEILLQQLTDSSIKSLLQLAQEQELILVIRNKDLQKITQANY